MILSLELANGFDQKLAIYLVACRAFMARRHAIDACRDRAYNQAKCEERFNTGLAHFLTRERPSSLMEAAADFRTAFLDVFGRDRKKGQHVSVIAVFDDLFDYVLEVASSFIEQGDSSQATYLCISSELNLLHQQGRRAAQQFFDDPYWQGDEQRRQRLERRCSLHVAYAPPIGIPDRSGFIQPYGRTPMKYDPALATAEQPGLINLYFNERYDFALFLSYPFLFLHEYTAHVFAVDECETNAPRFSDGWMMYAAASFWTRAGNNRLDWWGHDDRQIDALNRVVKRLIPATSSEADAIERAIQIHLWLGSDMPDAFERWTRELASFDSRSTFWQGRLDTIQPPLADWRLFPTHFVNDLAYAYSIAAPSEVALIELRQHLLTASDVIDIWRPLRET